MTTYAFPAGVLTYAAGEDGVIRPTYSSVCEYLGFHKSQAHRPGQPRKVRYTGLVMVKYMHTTSQVPRRTILADPADVVSLMLRSDRQDLQEWKTACLAYLGDASHGQFSVPPTVIYSDAPDALFQPATSKEA